MSFITAEKIAIEPIAIKAWTDNRLICIELYDDRIISFPAHKFTRLANATDEQLSAVRIRALGTALRWDELDEDISVSGIIQGFFEAD